MEDFIHSEDTAFIIVDVQDKLMKVIPDKQILINNINKLIDVANLLEIKGYVSEQNPSKLGGTIPSIKTSGLKKFEKMEFSCFNCLGSEDIIRDKKNILISGIETHICVLQSCIDFKNQGYNVHLAIDACQSRNSFDHNTAIKRLEQMGVVLTTVETTIFELCKSANNVNFRMISKIIKGN